MIIRILPVKTATAVGPYVQVCHAEQQAPVPLPDCHHVPADEHREILLHGREPSSAGATNDTSLSGRWSASSVTSWVNVTRGTPWTDRSSLATASSPRNVPKRGERYPIKKGTWQFRRSPKWWSWWRTWKRYCRGYISPSAVPKDCFWICTTESSTSIYSITSTNSATSSIGGISERSSSTGSSWQLSATTPISSQEHTDGQHADNH